jgi:hypothetical protein
MNLLRAEISLDLAPAHRLFFARIDLIDRPAVHSIFELLPSITVGFRHSIDAVTPMTHLVKKRHASKKDVTAERGKSEVSVGVAFKFGHDIIVDFDMSGISGATESGWYTTLAAV